MPGGSLKCAGGLDCTWRLIIFSGPIKVGVQPSPLCWTSYVAVPRLKKETCPKLNPGVSIRGWVCPEKYLSLGAQDTFP